MRDYFNYTEHPSVRDIPLLKTGRHFRLDNGDKVIIARNGHECRKLKDLRRESDHLLVPLNFSGPAVILQGSSLPAAVEQMLRYTKKPVQETDLITHAYMGNNKTVFLYETLNKSFMSAYLKAAQLTLKKGD